MNIREIVLKNKSHIYPKDILKKTFLFDDKNPVKKIHVDNKRTDNERYLIKVIFEGEQRPLCLTKRALNDLRISTSNYTNIVVRVRFDGKIGDKKATRWLFSVVTDEKPFNWSDAMGTPAKQSEPAKERKVDVTTMDGTMEYLKNYKRGMII